MRTLIDTVYGKVEGFEKNGVACFFGIPYAKAPLGDLRFRVPQPVEPWDGVLEAKGFKRDPMQAGWVKFPDAFSEDCLYLNIWVPESAGENAPVILWVPGGAFTNGGSGAATPEGPTAYDCENIARETGCILVSMSYRLNAFGFLNLNYLSDRFDDNVGMKDIVMSMHWVNEAISAFGGDPNNVTLFGESAGGEAITALMMVDEAQPLYHKVIIESNCFGSFYTEEENKTVCELYLETAGLKGNPEGLLDLSYEAILEANKVLDVYAFQYHTGRCSFCPVVDGKFIKAIPTLADYESFDKPVLIGSNFREGNFQMMFTWPDVAKYAPLVVQKLPAEQQKKVLGYYDLPDKYAFGEMLTDIMYTFPKIRFAERVSRGKSQVYVYRFDYYPAAQEKMGLYCCHVTELLPLFEIQTQPFRSFYLGSEEEVHQLGVRMRRRWGAFAHTGSPNVDGFEQWLPYTEDQRYTLIIDREDRQEMDPEKLVRDRYEGFDRILL